MQLGLARKGSAATGLYVKLRVIKLWLQHLLHGNYELLSATLSVRLVDGFVPEVNDLLGYTTKEIELKL